MTKSKWMKEVDDLNEEIAALEATEHVQLYNALKEELESGLNELRQIAQEEGSMQTKFFRILKVQRKVVDWKGFVEWLYAAERLRETDTKIINKEFTQERIYGEARRIKTGDSETSL